MLVLVLLSLLPTPFKTTTGSSDQVTVGHVPRSISRVCWYFIQHDGEITCKITGERRRSDQGGLVVPCEYNFIGKKKQTFKVDLAS